MELFDLHGKVAIVTGGNGGLGRGMAIGLASAGADIVIAARNQTKTATTAAELRVRYAHLADCPGRGNGLRRVRRALSKPLKTAPTIEAAR